MNGFINILKPPGPSSAQIVGAVKKMFGIKKVGHTGTLDPAAAGVLPICIGRATKFSDYVMNGEKEYIAEISFGFKTDTLDSLGRIVARNERVNISKSQLLNEISSFIGEIEQIVPAYSAVKYKGMPLYKTAVKNQITNRPSRKVIIKNIDILSGSNNRYLLKIECSKGTYIRTLIDDLGEKLNTYAYTSFLLRTKSGNFSIENSYTLDELQDNSDKNVFLISVSDALSFMPKLVLKDYLFSIATTGSPIDIKRANLSIDADTDYRVYCNNIFLGVARSDGNELKFKTFYYISGR